MYLIWFLKIKVSRHSKKSSSFLCFLSVALNVVNKNSNELHLTKNSIAVVILLVQRSLSYYYYKSAISLIYLKIVSFIKG